MNKQLTIFLACALSIGFFQNLFAQSCADEANVFEFMYNGKKYEIVKELKSWTNAAACAAERGGYLLEINSQEEQDSMLDAVLNKAAVANNYKSIADGGGSSYIWIGATDKHVEGTWIWDGNDDSMGINFWIGEGKAGTGGGMSVGGKYTNWGGSSKGDPNEPDDYANKQDGAAMALSGWPAGTTLLGSTGEWNDIDASNTLYFMIEYDSSTSGSCEAEKEEKFSLFPNPTNGVVQLQFNSDKIRSLELRDIMGKLIQSTTFTSNTQLDLTNLQNGCYFFILKHDDQIIQIEKVMKY